MDEESVEILRGVPLRERSAFVRAAVMLKAKHDSEKQTEKEKKPEVIGLPRTYRVRV